MAEYCDANRAFLQAFLAKSVLTLETAKPILAAILSTKNGREIAANDITVGDLRDYISAANDALLPLDLEIRSTFHQKTRERYYALINTTSDPLMQLATTYRPDEIAFLKRLLDAMFDGPANRGKKEAMCLTNMDATNLARGGDSRRDTAQNGAIQQNGVANQSLSMTDAQKVLDKLQQEGWFEKSNAGYLSLSPRALMELKSWLVDTYNDPDDEDEEASVRKKIKFCHACKEIITTGQRCPQRDCLCRVHDICTDTFFRMQKSQTCPLCKTAWDGKHFVGERTYNDRGASRHTGRRSSNVATADNNNDQDQDDEDDTNET